MSADPFAEFGQPVEAASADPFAEFGQAPAPVTPKARKVPLASVRKVDTPPTGSIVDFLNVRPLVTTVQNYGPDIVEAAKGLGEMAMHPVRTGEAIGQLAIGALESANPWGRASRREAPRTPAEREQASAYQAWQQGPGRALRSAWEDPNAAVEAVGRAAVKHPFDATLLAASGIAGVGRATGSEMLSEAGSALGRAAMAPVTAPVKAAASKVRGAKTVEEAVRSGLAKGTRRMVEGKRSWSQRSLADKKAVEGVKEIVANRENLVFKNPDGSETVGMLPKGANAADQHAQAIHQTKRAIFDRMQGEAAAAGEAGMVVTSQKALDKLDDIITNRVKQIADPELVRIAETRRAQLADPIMDEAGNVVGWQPKQFSPTEAMDLLADLNEKNRSFWGRQGFDRQQAVPAYITELEAQGFREALDDAVTQFKGPGHADLRRKYGAVKSLEREANKRVVVNDRGAPRSLADFIADVEAMKGLASAATGDLIGGLKAATMWGLKKYHKYANNPNTILSKMYSEVESLTGPKRGMTALRDVIKARGDANAAAAAERAASLRPKEVPSIPNASEVPPFDRLGRPPWQEGAQVPYLPISSRWRNR